MKCLKCFLFILLLLSCNNENIDSKTEDAHINIDETNQVSKNLEYIILDNVFIDENRLGEYYKNVETGILLHEENPGSYWDNIVESVFINNNSTAGREIYYKGEFYRGQGVFFIKNRDKKIVILETQVAYGPMLKWYGENTVEIISRSGDYYETHYFDFRTTKMSNKYVFPLHFDKENNVVLIWGSDDFELYNIETNKLIKEYNFRRDNGMSAAWPYIKYYVEEENNRFIMYYDDWNLKRKGKFIFDITR